MPERLHWNTVKPILKEVYVPDIPTGPVGMGVSYLVGHSKDETVKIDLFEGEALGVDQVGFCGEVGIVVEVE